MSTGESSTRSCFWTFTCNPRCEFDSTTVPFDPIKMPWLGDMQGPIWRLSPGHWVVDTSPKALFVRWTKTPDWTVHGYIEYDLPVSAQELVKWHGNDMVPVPSADMGRDVPSGHLHQTRVNDFDAHGRAYALTEDEARDVMARSSGKKTRRFPMCRGRMCWCYDCAMDSVRWHIEDERELYAAGHRYATYVRGRYRDK